MMNKPYGASPLQRQRELDAFEEQRQAYNTAMRDYEEAAAQQPVANFDAGGEVRKMYLEQTGREAEQTAVDYFSKRFGEDGKIDADELEAFRTMAGQEVINNDIRKAAAAEQAAANSASANTAQVAATTSGYGISPETQKLLDEMNAAVAAAQANVAQQTAKQMFLEQTGRPAEQTAVDYFSKRFGAEVDADELAIFRQMAGQEVVNNDARKATAAAQLAALTAAAPATTAPATTAPATTAPATTAPATTNSSLLPLTAAVAKDLMLRSMTTGAPTAEFDRYGGYKAVKDAYTAAGGTFDLDNVPAETLTALAKTVAQTGVGDLQILKKTGVPLSMVGYQNMLKNGIDPASAASFLKQFGAITPAKVTPVTPVPLLPSLTTNYTGSNLTGVEPVDYLSNLTNSPVSFNRFARRRRDGTLAQTPSALDYSSLGVGAIGDASSLNPQAVSLVNPALFKKRPMRGAATRPGSYFALTPETSTGLAPGTAALGSVDMPLYGGKTTLKALGNAPNLSPGMLGGLQNADYRTDRLGNRIYAPGAKPLFGFSKGGDVDLEALAQNTDDEPEDVINTDPLGTAQKMMSDFNSVRQTSPKASPTPKATKQTKSAPAKSGSAKMEYEALVKGDLGAMGSSPPAFKDTDSAQAQMRELARVYQLKAQAARERGRGFSADTFGAPTLEQPTLTKRKLTKPRFNKGGEAKKPEGDVAEPLQSPEEQPVTEESSASRALGAFVSRLKEGAQGYLGLDPGISGSDSYRTGQALSNMPGVGAPAAVAGIFIGKGAKGWNNVSNALAKKATKQGAAPEEVWRTTGNFKAPDGQWRQEISDADAQMRESIFQGPANRILSHPELFANYPDLGKIMTSKDPYTTKSVLFSGAAGPDALIRLGTAGGKNENAKGMLHELQHAIQFKEGFGQGGSKDMAFTDPKAFEILKRIRTNVARPISIDEYAKEAWQSSNVTPEIAAMYQKYLDYHKKSLKTMDIEAQKTAGREYYNRLLGEAEARAVEARKPYTMDERLQVIPSKSYRTNGGRDIIPLDQLIVKRSEGSPVEGERAPKLTGVNRVVDSIAQRLPADFFPTAARTLLETIQGKKEPITESNFSPKELVVLRQLIESTGGRGDVQYKDYLNLMKKEQQEKGTIPMSINPSPLSVLDPIGNVQTTLGRFTYSQDANGNLVVVDKYDFNPVPSFSGAYGAIRNYAGEKIPRGSGREVKINLGKPVAKNPIRTENGN